MVAVSLKKKKEYKDKIVWIEEFDNMSFESYKALRALIEQYMRNARFICTANYINKIPEEIQSRFTLYEFTNLSLENIYPRAEHICKEEGITFDEESLKLLIKNARGDLRSVIKNLQKVYYDDKNLTKEKVLNMTSDTDIVYDKLISGEWSYLRFELPKMNLDYNDLLVFLANKFFNSDYDISVRASINDIIAKGQVDMAFSFDKDICISAIFYRIIKVLLDNDN